MLSYNRLKNIYNNANPIFKTIYALIPRRIKYGKTYFNWKKEYNLQLKRDPFDTYITAIKIPFYSKKYKNCNINSFDDIPFLTKEEIQQNLTAFPKNRNDYFVTTGGVTGKPGIFYQSKNVWLKELAFVHKFLEDNGFDYSKIAVLKGGDQRKWKKRIYYYDPRNRSYMMSPFHLKFENVDEYYRLLKKQKIKFIHAHPSAISHFMSLLKKKSLSYKGLKYILITSEGFSNELINSLEKFFGCKIISFYGHSERGVFATGVSNLSAYRVNQNYGYFELIDDKGFPIQENQRNGEIVVTTYDNQCMPLIRYRTGDYSYYINYEEKIIGKISGKWNNEFLIGKNDERISFTALNIHDRRLNCVSNIQFIQINPGHVEVLYSTKNINTTKENLEVKNFFEQNSNSVITFFVKETDKFYRTEAGKIPLLIKERNE